MTVVFFMAAVLWGTGVAMGTPKRARWVMIIVLILGVTLAQFALPLGHPIREATGRDARLWPFVMSLVAIVYGYRIVLRKVKERAGTAQISTTKSDSFSNTELDRYARHIMLREVGGRGQKALHDARILVIGAGGLGSPVLQYLAAAGVGVVGVIDDDVVENANLQRQVVHTDARIGMPKVLSAAAAISEQNPYVTVRPYHRRLTQEIAAELFADYDLILDGTDNFETRYLVNQNCVALGKPLISGALTQWEGQVSLYDPARGAPCYACVFPTAPDRALVPSCAEAGVISPLPGVIGAMMAVEAIKEVAEAGEGLRGRLLIYDALYTQTRIISIKRNADCKVCAGLH